MVGPSARYIDDGDYIGGFSAEQIEELLQFLESNHMGWSAQMAPAIMGNPDRPELAEELTNSFCRTDPEIAKAFARVTFTSDNRADLASVDIPTLVLQCSEDIIASQEVGEFVHRRSRQRDDHLEGDRALPQSQRTRRSHRRHANIRLRPPVDDDPDRRFRGHGRELALRLHHAAAERSHPARKQDPARVDGPRAADK